MLRYKEMTVALNEPGTDGTLDRDRQITDPVSKNKLAGFKSRKSPDMVTLFRFILTSLSHSPTHLHALLECSEANTRHNHLKRLNDLKGMIKACLFSFWGLR